MIGERTRMQTVLAAAGVTLSYGPTRVLDSVDVTVERSESVAVVGASGSGKTTLLHCASGLVRPDAGSVRLAGEDITGLSDGDVARVRLRHVGFVFQSSDLVPELTLAENVELPLRLVKTGRRGRVARVRELVEALGLGDAAGRRPHEVSGGQAQRAAIARALVARPSIVFADEPTGALDSANREVVLDLLGACTREQGASLLMVTHDADAAGRADRVVTMSDGRLQQ